LRAVICEELNVKRLTLAEEAGEYVTYEVKPNFQRLGPRLGKDVKAVAGALAQMDAAELARAASAGEAVTVAYDGGSEKLSPEDLDIRLQAREGYVAAQGQTAVVVLDTTVTPALKREGLAREVINRIQSLRKEEDLPYEAHIRVSLACEGELREAVEEYAEMIRRETLATELTCDGADLDAGVDAEVEKQPLRLSLAVVPGGEA
jgi:isoleucyl-tRNA synthetase